MQSLWTTDTLDIMRLQFPVLSDFSCFVGMRMGLRSDMLELRSDMLGLRSDMFN